MKKWVRQKKMWRGGREIGGKFVNLSSSNRFKVAQMEAGILRIALVLTTQGSTAILPVKKDLENWARNVVLMIWSTILNWRDSEISEWNTIGGHGSSEVTARRFQIALRHRKYPQPFLSEIRDYRRTLKTRLFLLSRSFHKFIANQLYVKLSNNHSCTVIYSSNFNRIRN